jgi:diacylglycerol O-acyltransferase
VTRLSPLDAAFLAVESSTAHMHVGFAATFEPPSGQPRPSFGRLLRHIEDRLHRAPRYRQMLVGVPFRVHHPVWADDQRFDVSRHVIHSESPRLAEVVDERMSEPLPRDRPLWEICVANRLEDGTVGIIGKAHHCMVDGIAAVELASLLLDRDPDLDLPAPDRWQPQPRPEAMELFVRGVLDRVRDELELARLPARLASSPQRLLRAGGEVPRIVRALADSLRPAAEAESLNAPISPLRHLALLDRPIDDLVEIKRSFGVKLNDVLLAVSAGGVRRFLTGRGERPLRLKTMVPVNVREPKADGELGNRISFMFIDLPCDEPDPVRRLKGIHIATSERKEGGDPKGADAVLRSIAYAPHTLQQLVSRMIASPRAFNLVVSNIPGPREQLYMCGCELQRAYPVVPIADRHALSVGVSTIRDRACFGLYTDRRALPDADLLAGEIGNSIDELLQRSGVPQRSQDATLAW